MSPYCAIVSHMPVTFRLKPKAMQVTQWSGSNWHEMLEVFGRDVVSTDGKDLFVKFPKDPVPYKLNAGDWLSTDLGVFDDEGLATHWDRVEDV